MTLAVLYTTFADLEQARRFADAVLAAKLAACVNVLPGMTALYRWEGAMQEASEVAALIKTQPAHRDALMGFLTQHHPYDTPAALWFETAAASAAFAAWVREETDGG